MTTISYVSTDTTVATNPSSTTSKDEDNDGISDEQEVFLSILLTQLENQNPLDPVDTTEFTNQLVAYSSLEQEMETNDNLESIISSMDDYNTLSAFSYIGMEVELDTSSSIMQDGETEWEYILEDDAEDVTIQIADSSGNVIASYDVEAGTAGTYSFTLANSDLSEGLDEGALLYLGVIATDEAGEEIGTDVISVVSVDSVETSDNEITLTAGKLKFSSNDVLSLRQSSGS